MILNVDDEISDLLINLANALHDRYPDSNFVFNDKDAEITKEWLNSFILKLLECK